MYSFGIFLSPLQVFTFSFLHRKNNLLNYFVFIKFLWITWQLNNNFREVLFFLTAHKINYVSINISLFPAKMYPCIRKLNKTRGIISFWISLIPHFGLKMPLPNNFTRWLTSCPYRRLGACLYNLTLATFRHLRAGIPQSSIMAPCLFCYYMSD